VRPVNSTVPIRAWHIDRPGHLCGFTIRKGHQPQVRATNQLNKLPREPRFRRLLDAPWRQRVAPPVCGNDSKPQLGGCADRASRCVSLSPCRREACALIADSGCHYRSRTVALYRATPSDLCPSRKPSMRITPCDAGGWLKCPNLTIRKRESGCVLMGSELRRVLGRPLFVKLFPSGWVAGYAKSFIEGTAAW